MLPLLRLAMLLTFALAAGLPVEATSAAPAAPRNPYDRRPSTPSVARSDAELDALYLAAAPGSADALRLEQARTRFHAGVTAFEAGSTDAARDDFEAALAAQQSFAGWRNLGATLMVQEAAGVPRREFIGTSEGERYTFQEERGELLHNALEAAAGWLVGQGLSTDAGLQRMRGDLAFDAGENDTALAHYLAADAAELEAALALDLAVNTATALYRLDRDLEARDGFRQAALQERELGLPPAGDLLCKLAAAEWSTGDVSQAVELMDEAHDVLAREDGLTAEYWVVRASILSDADRIEDALAAMEQCLSALAAVGDEPSEATALQYVGLLSALNQTERAEQVFRGMLGEAPYVDADADSLSALAGFQILNDDLDGALVTLDLALERATEQDVPRAELLSLRGSLQRMRGEPQAGLDDLQAALELAGTEDSGVDEAKLLLELADMLSGFGRSEEGLAAIDRAERLHAEQGLPPTPVFAWSRAGLHSDRGDRNALSAEFLEGERIAAGVELDFDEHLQRAWLQYRLRDVQATFASIDAARSALVEEGRPELMAIDVDLLEALALSNWGHHERAQALLSRARGMNSPLLQAALDLLEGVVLYDMGRRDEGCAMMVAGALRLRELQPRLTEADLAPLLRQCPDAEL